MHELRELRGISRRNAYLASRARLVVNSFDLDRVVDALADVDGVVVGHLTTLDPADYGVYGSAECVNWAGRRTMDAAERDIKTRLQAARVA